jgi:glycosyltransferase involved in cell wall biosynthesis
MASNYTIVIPAYNEATSLAALLPGLKAAHPDAPIIVVDDGSHDHTAEVCQEHAVERVAHPYNMGNGAAVKSGVRAAKSEVVVLMDADGQHQTGDITRLLAKMAEGYDMVVGARARDTHAGLGRRLANGFYNVFASKMTGHDVQDLTSGFRVVVREKFLEYIHMLPNGFSYPTTITMAFFHSGYPIAYIPIRAQKRTGKSHIKPLKDGLRFLLIIFKVGTLYSPLKIYVPISVLFFLIGCGYYAYTYLTMGRFTNMSMMLFTTALIVFLMGLVSEQITNLMYQNSRK